MAEQSEQKSNLSVGGFRFLSKEDAELALQEKERIAYLERHLDYRNPQNVMAIYHKAIESRIFRTPVGLEFMKNVQSLLDKTPVRDEVRDIPVYQTYVLPKTRTRDQVEARQRVRSNPLKEVKRKYGVSVAINMVLVVAVLVMFWITLKSDTPNMLNYRSAIVNEYSAWEQDLTERENAVREKELSLQMD